jgi:ZIP family zinc transporter
MRCCGSLISEHKKSMFMPEWLMAGLWGLVAGSALIIGAAVGLYAHISQRWISAVM